MPKTDIPLDGLERAVDEFNSLPSPSPHPPTLSPSAAPLALSRAGYRGMVRMHEPNTGPFQNGGRIWSMPLIKTALTWFTSVDGYFQSVEEALPEIIWQVTHWREYEYLLKSFQVYGQQVPIRMLVPMPGMDTRIRDGIHRVAIAEVLGWDSMLVTHGPLEKSMWQYWDNNTPDGTLYHKVKSDRMRFDGRV